MKSISTKLAPQAIGPYVQANQIGNILYTSGQIPLDKDGNLAGEDITSQTHQVMKNIEAILNEAKSDFNHIIKTTCFLSDMNNFVEFNKVYASYFDKILPARSCVEVARLPKDVLVEVEVIAICAI
ncbi:MAG: RidA family protein [Burkholderiales bacterium]|nr:RidA family protein [Burkholderiales bacterium]